MTPKIFVIAVSSFVIGLVTGSFVYYTEFRREFEDPAPVTPQVPQSIIAGATPDKTGFVVTATAYGGCERTSCPSYRVSSEGAYIYSSAETVEGVLPEAALNNLETVINAAPLLRFSQPVERSVCSSFTDGRDFTYDITYQGESYKLDTCRTNFSNDSDLGELLLAFWQDFSDLE